MSTICSRPSASTARSSAPTKDRPCASTPRIRCAAARYTKPTYSRIMCSSWRSPKKRCRARRRASIAGSRAFVPASACRGRASTRPSRHSNATASASKGRSTIPRKGRSASRSISRTPRAIFSSSCGGATKARRRSRSRISSASDRSTGMPDSVASRLDQAIKGIGYVVIEVGDAAAAERFYAELLGFAPAGRDRWPGAARSASLAAPSGQHLVLAEASPRNDPRIGAAHQAYRLDPALRARIAQARQADLHAYREDRPSEEADRFYLDAPWGNRIQLVARSDRPAGIDHVAIETNNILWAREFY